MKQKLEIIFEDRHEALHGMVKRHEEVERLQAAPLVDKPEGVIMQSQT